MCLTVVGLRFVVLMAGRLQSRPPSCLFRLDLESSHPSSDNSILSHVFSTPRTFYAATLLRRGLSIVRPFSAASCLGYEVFRKFLRYVPSMLRAFYVMRFFATSILPYVHSIHRPFYASSVLCNDLSTS